jgi:hypothetical protein
MWVARIAWGVLVVAEGPLVAAALRDASRPVQLVGSLGGWAGWAAVLVLTLIPSPSTLTAYRLLAPGAALVAVVAATRDVGSTAVAAGIASALVAVFSAFVAELGEGFVQAGAYGAERRFPLRPPGPLVVTLLPAGWLVAAGALLAGPLLLAARQWVAGGLLIAVGLGWSWIFAPRCHQLSRRFAVFVPAGFVLHDHAVLADTAMFRASTVRGLRLAPAGSEAADATGAALGVAVELALTESSTIVLAATRATPRGTALHVLSVLFSPSRPGRLLSAAAERGWTR